MSFLESRSHLNSMCGSRPIRVSSDISFISCIWGSRVGSSLVEAIIAPVRDVGNELLITLVEPASALTLWTVCVRHLLPATGTHDGASKGLSPRKQREHENMDQLQKRAVSRSVHKVNSSYSRHSSPPSQFEPFLCLVMECL